MTAQEVDQLKREEIDLLRDENCRLCDELHSLRSLVALLTGLVGRAARREGIPAEELQAVQVAVSALLDLSEQTRADLVRQIETTQAWVDLLEHHLNNGTGEPAR